MQVLCVVVAVVAMLYPAASQRTEVPCTDARQDCQSWTRQCSDPWVVQACPYSCGACQQPSRQGSGLRPSGSGPGASGPSPTFTPEHSITRPSFSCGSPYTTIPAAQVRTGVRNKRQTRGHDRVSPSQPSHTAGDGIAGLSDDAAAATSEVFCGATVISDRYLLTAAHCVIHNPAASVRLGDLDLSRDDEVNAAPQDYQIELIVVHPEYDSTREAGYNDLALLRTARPIAFNEAVFPFCVRDTRPGPGATLTGAGFGFVNETTKATHLQEAELQVVSPAECEGLYNDRHAEVLKSWYPRRLQNSDILCAGAPGKSACKGDGGGPLYQEDNSGKLYLVGIISAGLPCTTGDNNTLPGFYISVADHVPFIDQVLYGDFLDYSTIDYRDYYGGNMDY